MYAFIYLFKLIIKLYNLFFFIILWHICLKELIKYFDEHIFSCVDFLIDIGCWSGSYRKVVVIFM